MKCVQSCCCDVIHRRVLALKKMENEMRSNLPDILGFGVVAIQSRKVTRVRVLGYIYGFLHYRTYYQVCSLCIVQPRYACHHPLRYG